MLKLFYCQISRQEKGVFKNIFKRTIADMTKLRPTVFNFMAYEQKGLATSGL